MKKSDLIIVRGAGDLATGTIHRLKKSGFHLLVLETDHPAAIRRQVALSEAVYSGSTCVENVEAVRIESVDVSGLGGRKSSGSGGSEGRKYPVTETEGCGGCDPCKEKSRNNKRYGTAYDRTRAWILCG